MYLNIISTPGLTSLSFVFKLESINRDPQIDYRFSWFYKDLTKAVAMQELAAGRRWN